MPDDLSLRLLAARHGQLVTLDDVRDCGIGSTRWNRMLDEGWWLALTPHHFHPSGVAPGFEMQARAGSDWLGKACGLYADRALWWLGVDVPQPFAAAFLVPRGRRGTLPWLELHTTTKWDPADVVLHRGVRTCVASRAVIDLAANGPKAAVLETAIDSAVQQRRTALPRLIDRMRTMSGKGHHGCALLREILLDSGGESFLERRFLRLVRLHRLPRPKVQVTPAPAVGRRARVDFLFGRLVVEVSGRLGHVTDSDRTDDMHRRHQLEDQGFTIKEFTTAMVIDEPAYVVDVVRRGLSVTAATS
ncbi:MAG: hypothetical protein ACOYMR_11300 [Ilumatobacteraceae bacterium]